MIQVIKTNITSYRRFFVLLARYISLNTRLVVIYGLALVADSFAKAFCLGKILRGFQIFKQTHFIGGKVFHNPLDISKSIPVWESFWNRFGLVIFC